MVHVRKTRHEREQGKFVIWNGESNKSMPMALIQRLAAVVKHLIASCLYTSIPPKYLAEIKDKRCLVMREPYHPRASGASNMD